MKFFLAICAAMVTWPNFAALAPIEVIDLNSSSSCGRLRHEINTDPNDPNIQCLRVYFDDFAVVSSANASSQRNCHMNARLRIPANIEFQASEAVAEGVYNIVGDAFSGILLSYKLTSIGAESSWHQLFNANSSGDFNFQSTMADGQFTPCTGYETEVELVSDLHAFIDQRSNDSSFISLDETGKRLSWNWKVRRCEADLFNKPFITYYSAPNGRRYRAPMIITNNRGSYRSEAGFVGDLFNIRRSQEGRVLEGDWSAQGVSGQFKFTITDARTGSFNGSWRDSSGRKGTWTGSYE